MDTIAAVLTGKSSAAISSIAVYGQQCLKACGGIVCEDLNLNKGDFKLCRISEQGCIVDEVLLCREQDDCCVISSHGNPLIVDMITSMLAGCGVKVVSAQELTETMLTEQGKELLTVEVKLTQSKAASLQAVRLLQNQNKAGLGLFVEQTIKSDDLEVGQIHEKCRQILADSAIAERLLRRVKIVIAGLPNSGKSLLFNRLCGREAAIVADYHGTTRDWLSARCMLGSMSAELIDTAGLDKTLEGIDDIDSLSRKAAAKLIADGDVVLYVIDANLAKSEKVCEVEGFIRDISKGIVIKVYNKIDTLKSTTDFMDGCLLSAQNETGIEELIQTIIRSCGTDSLKPDTAICFTSRQKQLIEQALTTTNPNEIRTALRQIKEGTR